MTEPSSRGAPGPPWGAIPGEGRIVQVRSRERSRRQPLRFLSRHHITIQAAARPARGRRQDQTAEKKATDTCTQTPGCLFRTQAKARLGKVGLGNNNTLGTSANASCFDKRRRLSIPRPSAGSSDVLPRVQDHIAGRHHRKLETKCFPRLGHTHPGINFGAIVTYI